MLRMGQSGLLLADRGDGSMGRSVTALTRENAVQTRHVVGVGVTTQQVHSADTFAVVTRTPARAQRTRRMTRPRRHFVDRRAGHGSPVRESF